MLSTNQTNETPKPHHRGWLAGRGEAVTTEALACDEGIHQPLPAPAGVRDADSCQRLAREGQFALL